MFFLLSKTIGIMLLPTNFLIGIGLLGASCWPRGGRSLGRRLMIVSVVLLAICGFSPLGNWLLYPLEARFPPWDAARGAPDGIVVLGGSIDADLSAAHGVAVFTQAADRIDRGGGAGPSISERAHHLFRRKRQSDRERRRGKPITPPRCSNASASPRSG